MAINVNELHPLKLYSDSNKLYLPINKKDKRHGSVIFLLAPDHESALNILDTPYLVNRKCYESYYTEKDINLIINQENGMISPNQYITESNNINKLKNYYSSGRYVFHGSPIQGLKSIDSHISKSYSDLGPIIFASPQPEIAACFMFNWNDSIMRLGTDKDKNPSCWFIKNYKTFGLENPGSIYVLDKQGFNKMNNSFEMYNTSKSLPVVYEEKFNNVLEALMLFNIEFYDYNTKKKISIESDNTMNKIIALNNQLNAMPYGFYLNGKRIDLETDEEWYEKYRTQDPNNVITNNGGVCWDFAGYEALYFKENFSNIEYHCYFIALEDDTTHTFLVFKYNNKYYYIESSFKAYCGIWESKTLEDIFNFIIKNMCNFDNHDIMGFDIYEYDATNKKLYQNLDTIQFENMIKKKIGKKVSHKYNDNKRNVHLLESFTEAKLSSKEKKSFDNSIYGLPKQKKYPMPDANHVRSAISYFSKCPDENKKELAKNIKKKAKQFGVEISKDSPINKYTGDEIVNEIK